MTVCVRCGADVRPGRRYCGLACYRSREASATLAERFWAKVDRRGPDECWPWTGARTAAGYGLLRSGPAGHQRREHAHRLALAFDGRPLGPGQVTRHTCDNPPCVNPAHLVPGTAADNSRDCVERGRSRNGFRQGAAHPQAKLTEDDVNMIRELGRDHGITRLAARFGVSRATVDHILARRLWRHLP